MGDPIYLANDHRGYPLKRALRERLEASGYDVCDLGTHGTESVDYPEFAAPAARAVSTGEASRAIVICGRRCDRSCQGPVCSLSVLKTCMCLRMRRKTPAFFVTSSKVPSPRLR